MDAPVAVLKFFVDQALVHSVTVTLPVSVGRRDASRGEAAPVSVTADRVVIADETEVSIPRRWFRIDTDAGGELVLENIHSVSAVFLDGGATISSGCRRALRNEATVLLGNKSAVRITIDEAGRGSDDHGYSSLSSLPTVPGRPAETELSSILAFDNQQSTELVEVLQAALQVVNEAAGSSDFYDSATEAISKILEMDRVIALVPVDGLCSQDIHPYVPAGWALKAEHSHVPQNQLNPLSRRLLQDALASKKTVIYDPLSPSEFNDVLPDCSLADVRCAVASPVLDRDSSVIALFYGDRVLSSGKDVRVTSLQATTVQLIASTVAGGIARTQEERSRSALSQFFSPRVADQLISDPSLIDGSEAEVTVLFCDIRGFSATTQQLGPKKSIEWINDVFSEVSQCILDRNGVLVDYVGDEIFAMWGAPTHQPDHAQRALETARAILQRVDPIRDRWASILQSDFSVGIGINTGLAQVGNVGSRQKFKYGPVGTVVNVGSRLQSATKQIGVPCVASESTILAALQADQCRRLGRIEVVGIEGSVDVFEVSSADDQASSELREIYQQALHEFESGAFEISVATINEIMHRFPQDRPARRLMIRVIEQLDHPGQHFDPVWKLPVK